MTTAAWGRLAIALGVAAFASGAFLIAMYVSLATGGSASPWGPINDVLMALVNLGLVGLVPWLGLPLARSGVERGFVWAVAGVGLVAALGGLAMVAGLLAFEVSTAISVGCILLQVLWMYWVNRRLAAEGRAPRVVSRFGLAFAVALLVGFVLVGASFGLGALLGAALPWEHPVALVPLVVGAGLGGIAWLVWPAWYLLLGRHLLRSARAATGPAPGGRRPATGAATGPPPPADGVPPAPTSRRGPR